MVSTILAYALAAVLGFVVGILDINKTYPRSSYEAFKSPAAWLLGAIHAVLAAIVYLIVSCLWKPDLPAPALGAIVGAGFNVLIRTKFMFARNIGTQTGAEGLGLDLGWIYDQLSQWLRTSIDRKVLSIREPVIKELASLAPSLDWLKQQALFLSVMLGPAAKEALMKKVNEVAANQAFNDELKKRMLAIEVCDSGGFKHTLRLVEELR